MSINGVSVLPPAPNGAVALSALPPFGVAEIRKRTHMIQEVMRGVMKENTHYGVIPGTPKPSLWKPGAELLCMTFRLAPLIESRVVSDDPDNEWSYHAAKRDGSIVEGTCIGFFEVESTCTIIGPGGETLSRCSARCNNRESKYRSLPLFEIRNTILKMSEKRAFLSATLMATGASDIFTQDLDDLTELVEALPKRPVSAVAKPPASPAHSQNLTPKREEWLLRVAQEGKIASDAVERCRAFLRSATSAEVKAFFDELARRKAGAFRSFLAA